MRRTFLVLFVMAGLAVLLVDCGRHTITILPPPAAVVDSHSFDGEWISGCFQIASTNLKWQQHLSLQNGTFIRTVFHHQNDPNCQDRAKRVRTIRYEGTFLLTGSSSTTPGATNVTVTTTRSSSIGAYAEPEVRFDVYMIEEHMLHVGLVDAAHDGTTDERRPIEQDRSMLMSRFEP